MTELLTVLPVTVATVVLGARLRAAGGPRRWLVALAAWWVGSLTLSSLGLFGVGARSALVDTLGFGTLAVLLAVPVVVVMRWRRGPAASAVVSRLGLPLLVGIQFYRVAGVAFVAAAAAGGIAVELGWVTAAWDVAVGLTAPLLAIALVGRRRWAATATWWWSLLGLADFVVAVTAAGLLFPVAGVGPLVDGVAPAALGRYPLAFISLYAVPLSIVLHVEVLARLGLPSTATGRQHRASRSSTGSQDDQPSSPVARAS